MESFTRRLDETEKHMLLRINTSNVPAAIMTEPSFCRGKTQTSSTTHGVVPADWMLIMKD